VPRTRPPYPPEFRPEAVRLIRSSGKPLSEISKDLGVSEQSLRVGIKQADLDEGHRDDG
jgi:transposase